MFMFAVLLPRVGECVRTSHVIVGWSDGNNIQFAISKQLGHDSRCKYNCVVIRCAYVSDRIRDIAREDLE